ncbi:hypothetical protein V2595_11430 [Tenacibaculum maritimum]
MNVWLVVLVCEVEFLLLLYYLQCKQSMLNYFDNDPVKTSLGGYG